MGDIKTRGPDSKRVGEEFVIIKSRGDGTPDPVDEEEDSSEEEVEETVFADEWDLDTLAQLAAQSNGKPLLEYMNEHGLYEGYLITEARDEAESILEDEDE